MGPKLLGRGRALLGWLFLIFGLGGPGCVGQSVMDVQRGHHDDYDYAAGTFLFGKLVLVPVLAAIGLKFLALLPIVLSKIALLSVMNFLSTNLNLLVSTLFGLKNFLGKHGLWAQEDNTTKRHPDLETFAEFANQPIMQPSFRYQYVSDMPPMSRIEPTKPPKMVKVFNGFVPTDYRLIPRKHDRRRFVKLKDQRVSNEQKSGTGYSKYKCYWVNEELDSKTQQQTGANSGNDGGGNTEIEREIVKKRKFDVADTPLSKAGNGFAGQLDTYAVQQLNDELMPPGEGLGSDFYDYRSLVLSSIDDPVYRQATAVEKMDNDVSDVQRLSSQQQPTPSPPFTGSQVKVAENYESTQQPILYVIGQVETTTAKFKGEATGV